MDWDGVEVLFRDDLPRRLHLLAGGPRRRLLINRGWWQRASVAERRQACNELALGTEIPGALLWMGGGGDAVAEGRLLWLRDVPLVAWERLLDEEG